ncbi:MAG: cation transporter [Clostridia bacterium]|nr:cation transporter [Clostridia bacterium]
MSMINVLIGLILAAGIVAAALRVRKRAKSGGGCCGDRPETLRKTPVKDHNRAHYPYEAELQIGGMTCENCARRVENALNSLDGVWATVRIDSHTAHLRLKAEPDMEQLREAVRQAGYVVMETR